MEGNYGFLLFRIERSSFIYIGGEGGRFVCYWHRKITKTHPRGLSFRVGKGKGKRGDLGGFPAPSWFWHTFWNLSPLFFCCGFCKRR